MERLPNIFAQPSIFDLTQLEDPLSYKNQSYSLKYIHSICQLPSFGEFNEFGVKPHNHFEERQFECDKEEYKININQDLSQAEEISDKEERSIGSTNINLTPGSNLSIGDNPELILNSPTAKKGTGCNCKKTGCIKMYCQCFSSGKACTDQCNCCNCSNCDIDSEAVKKAKEIAKNKHRFAFSPVDGTNRKHCNCRKTQCQKKYCECYNSGLTCTQLCKCQDCLNGTHSPDSHDEGVLQIAC